MIRKLLLALLALPLLAQATATADRSGTITAGGTSQVLVARNLSRGAVLVVNPTTASEVLCVSTNPTATTGQGSVCLSAGGSVMLRTTDAIAVIAATTAHVYTAYEIDDAVVVNPGSSSGGGGSVVTNAGTFAVQNTAATPAGTNLIGKVGIDQTTPGTTNAVVATSVDGGLTTLGSNADAAVGDATGTANAHLRQVAKSLVSIDSHTPTSGTAVMGASSPVTIATDDTVLGATNATAPASDTATSSINGRLQRIAQDVSALLTATGNSASSRVPVSLDIASPVSGTAAAAGVLSGFPIMVGRGAASIAVYITSNSATVNFESSPDNVVAYTAVQCWLTTNAGSATASSGSTQAANYVCPVRGNYFQARQSGAGATAVTVAPSASSALITTNAFIGNTATVAPYTPLGSGDWHATSGTTPLATTSSTALVAAGGAGVRNYAVSCQFYNTSATVSTTVAVLDGATALFAGFLPATTAALPIESVQVTFPVALRGTANTAMNVQLGTTAASVYYNCQGFTL